MRTEEKARLIRRVIVIALVCSTIALSTIPEYIEKYSDEISTIWSEGAKEGTGKDRMYLWTRALSMFLDYPLIGVGPGCYGHKISSYITQQTADEWGVRFQMYGRAIHNIYLEILTDMGLLGLSAFLSLLYVFRRRNLYTKEYEKRAKEKEPQKNAVKPSIPVFHYSLALEGGMLAFLSNGFFFNLFYYAWFWDLLILNTLLYLRISSIESTSVQ
jgi:O-antigen ligase